MCKPRCVNVTDFMQIAGQYLRQCDAQGLTREMKSRWRLSQIIALLCHCQCDVRRVAAMVLGFLGEPAAAGSLARALHDADEKVSETAEESLWRIWLSQGNAQASASLLRGIEAIETERFCCAIKHFTHTLQADPNFAEAHHQRSLAHAGLEQWDKCLDDCRSTIMLMPTHFAAMAGMGHCYLHLRQLRSAFDCYQQAMALNPRLIEQLYPTCQKIRQHLSATISTTPDQTALFELIGADRISLD